MNIAKRLEYAHLEGIFPSQILERMIVEGAIKADPQISPDAVQPASLDLRLGRTAWRVQASMLPSNRATVDNQIRSLAMYSLDLDGGAVLERGGVYIVPLLERLDLPEGVSAFTNPKSSTGRLDVFTRVISNRSGRFDRSDNAGDSQYSFEVANRYTHFDLIEAGYRGPLYAEVSPRTFSIRVRTGSRLTQLRLRRGQSRVAAADLLRQHARTPLVDRGIDAAEIDFHDGVGLHIDLSGEQQGDHIGWRARRHTGVVDFDETGRYAPEDYWEPLHARNGGLFLDPTEFYVLATREAVKVPPGYAAEMVPYNTLVGEFRVHYAGFFDPGFGYRARRASRRPRGVLEVRSHDVPFFLEDGQLVAHLRYERLAAPPERLYGERIRSHYQGQRLRLARQFRDRG